MNVLIFHHSADLYGSGKTLLDLVSGLDHQEFKVTVLMSEDGPLVPCLRAAGCTVHLVPLLGASRATFTPQNLLKLVLENRRSLRAIAKVVSPADVDIVHSNTIAVLSGAIWARLHRKPHLWHVHEIVETPAIVRKAFGLMLSALSDRVVHNSRATMLHWCATRPSLTALSEVVVNGMGRPAPADEAQAAALRATLGVPADMPVVTLVGRINRWKGQRLLVSAAGELWNRGVRNVRFLMVGSPPHGQGHFLDQLRADVAASPAREAITLMDFQSNIWTVWDASDVAVVPSIEPEPFGLVAVEAMVAGKPVIAAKHGGLVEIVESTGGGILFEPGNVQALAAAIGDLLQDEAKRKDLGRRGLAGVDVHFSIRHHVQAFEAIYRAMRR